MSHMRALKRLGWQVEFAPAQEITKPELAAALSASEITCHMAPEVGSVEEVLRRHAGGFELVYVHRAANAAAYSALVRQFQPRAKLVYGVADLHSLRLARQAEAEQRPEVAREAQVMRERELLAMRQADLVITHSPQEAALLRWLAPSVHTRVVRWAVEVPASQQPVQERNGVAFVGNFRHSPNLDAAHWLVTKIMPLVWVRAPEIVCVIAGADMPPRLTHMLRRDRVQLLGHVSDLSQVYRRARLAVAPLCYGAGIKGKVLEAFAAGVPCVMTPIAAEGLPLPNSLTAIVAQAPARFSDLICALHGDTAYSATLVQAGSDMVRQHFNEEKVSAALQAAIQPGVRSGTPPQYVPSLIPV